MARARKTLALLINNLEGYYLEPIWQGVLKACQTNRVDLHVFEGRVIESSVRNEGQHNIVYSMSGSELYDGYIISAGTLAHTLNQGAYEGFMKQFSGRPVVTLQRPSSGANSITIDSHASLKALTLHLILDHRRKNLVYIAGPVDNSDNQIREQAVRDALELALGPETSLPVLPGGFREPEGRRAMERLLESGVPFDGIVFFNDSLAQGGMAYLLEHGFNLPRDVSIIGFDNIASSQALVPSLTTAHQPLEEMGAEAVSLLVEGFDNPGAESTPRQIVLDSIPVFRQSCGCLGSFSSRSVVNIQVIQDFWKRLLSEVDDCISRGRREDIPSRVYSALAEEIALGRSVAPYQDIGQVIAKRLDEQLRKDTAPAAPEKEINNYELGLHVQMVHGAVMTAGESMDKRRFVHLVSNFRHVILEELYDLRIKSLFETLPGVLQNLGIQGCAVAFYETGVIRSPARGVAVPPDRAVWKFCYWNGSTVPLGSEGLTFPMNRIVPPGVGDPSGRIAGESESLLIQPLFHGNEHFGIVVFSLSMTDDLLFEGLRAQMSSVIKGSQVFEAKERTERRLRDTLDELKQKNQDLRSLSIRDELTGLYNRRGFIELGESHLHRAQLLDQWICVFYIDLDGLKAINDRYGHDEGDRAIVSAGDLLTRAFRSQDIVARYGGDEFTVLTSETDSKTAEVLVTRLKSTLAEFNNQNNLPYRLSLSIGFVSRRMNSPDHIESLLRKADSRMYTDKSKNSK
ncbi:diguanylate cyclase [Spirochaeta lutea]|uniref:diguanylate cyclase n=1 Tax=Spirochaeta lutea TaxID=1480694 RepID=UPI00068E953E|nr:GGDEF domain-containing protein [Spirochaeta lutea]